MTLSPVRRHHTRSGMVVWTPSRSCGVGRLHVYAGARGLWSLARSLRTLRIRCYQRHGFRLSSIRSFSLLPVYFHASTTGPAHTMVAQDKGRILRMSTRRCTSAKPGPPSRKKNFEFRHIVFAGRSLFSHTEEHQERISLRELAERGLLVRVHSQSATESCCD